MRANDLSISIQLAAQEPEISTRILHFKSFETSIDSLKSKQNSPSKVKAFLSLKSVAHIKIGSPIITSSRDSSYTRRSHSARPTVGS